MTFLVGGDKHGYTQYEEGTTGKVKIYSKRLEPRESLAQWKVSKDRVIELLKSGCPICELQ